MPARPRTGRPPTFTPRRQLLIVHWNQSTNVQSFACRARRASAARATVRAVAPRQAASSARQFVLRTVASRGRSEVAGGPALLVSPVPGLARGLQPLAAGDRWWASRRTSVSSSIPTSTRARSPPSQQGQPALDALETDWADKQTMLKMPEGKQKIDYHLLTGQHIADACDCPSSSAPRRRRAASSPARCRSRPAICRTSTSSCTPTWTSWRPAAMPIPLLVEGTAQSIGCGTETGTDLTYDVPWQQARGARSRVDARRDVYSEGRAVRALPDPHAGDRRVRALLSAGAGAPRSGAVRRAIFRRSGT